ncbi:hypothetical protein LY78DRAFT_189149 [Colletotrichum sublineola]|nr:hypothetical protein LY78DRAFT_189149 [Colletotrichum sublineola]
MALFVTPSTRQTHSSTTRITSSSIMAFVCCLAHHVLFDSRGRTMTLWTVDLCQLGHIPQLCNPDISSSRAHKWHI